MSNVTMEQVRALLDEYGSNERASMYYDGMEYTKEVDQSRNAIMALLKPLIEAQVEYPEPDWEALPAWANWGAIDNVGRICWFQVQPSHHVTGWHGGGMHGNSRIGNDLPLGCDWRLTLRQRPTAVG